jgi:hypothetical protein
MKLQGTLAAAAAMTLGALALPVSSGVAGGSFETAVSIDYLGSDGPPLYEGGLDSTKNGCRTNRKVLLVQRKNSGPDVLTDRVTSDGSGKWEWDGDEAKVDKWYYAKVKTKQIAAGTCEADRSPALQNH